MESMTIGQVAKQTGVGIETVRFYERERMIPKPPRRSSGYRAYPLETIARVAFIRNAKELGFSLREIRELLSLHVDSRANCKAVKQRGEEKIEDINSKLRRLQRMKRELTKLLHACNERQPTGPCPLLDALDHKDLGL